jgi:hypothetical protein
MFHEIADQDQPVYPSNTWSALFDVRSNSDFPEKRSNNVNGNFHLPVPSMNRLKGILERFYYSLFISQA